MAELKPCPFCGATPIVVANRYRHEETTFLIKCCNLDCKIIPTTYETDNLNYVIEAWNRRCDDGKDN